MCELVVQTFEIWNKVLTSSADNYFSLEKLLVMCPWELAETEYSTMATKLL